MGELTLDHFKQASLSGRALTVPPLPPLASTLRSPSSPIQEEDEEKLSEMSDAQANPLLSGSPAPTEVRVATPRHASSDRRFFAFNLVVNGVHLYVVLCSLQATGVEDVAESLSPDDGEWV